MRLFLSGLIAGVLVVGAWLMLAAYLGSIEYEGSEREPRERGARDTPTRTIEDEREEYDIESLVLVCPLGWHPPSNLPNGARYEKHELIADGRLFVPSEARNDTRVHQIEVWFCIDRSGATSNVEIKRASPSELWNQSVLNYIRRREYRPGKVDGQPVQICYCSELFALQAD